MPARDVYKRQVVFSVSNHEEDVVTALKRGADGYLLKDMEPEDLLSLIHISTTKGRGNLLNPGAGQKKGPWERFPGPKAVTPEG